MHEFLRVIIPILHRHDCIPLPLIQRLPTTTLLTSMITSNLVFSSVQMLTLWVPVPSTLHNSSGYFSISCCSWASEAKFQRSPTPMYHVQDADFTNSLNLGRDGSNYSSCSMYRIWLGSLRCDWKVESEMGYQVRGEELDDHRCVTFLIIYLLSYSTSSQNHVGDICRPSPNYKHWKCW